ncbi:GtrA family protein [Serratia odorifera]|uniref:GtrA family protein n=1 Tax=Serratia odorifera TaxID=618 RepID=UPI0018E7C805|nr:GtrA family protein [Serratia odorifera]MBJ2064472.1 GtrA family protein [Serratia odorifera]
MDKSFFKYVAIGVVNTAIHWAIFFAMLRVVKADQALSNFVAFCVAVSFSFFANSALTFKATATTTRYVMYVAFMGFLSIATGAVADRLTIIPWVTLIAFSGISLFCGYIYAKHIVFKERK